MQNNQNLTEKNASYWERINKTIDYIESNLEKKITLNKLAQINHFSKYHFHRIFSSFTGESLYNFINRLRIEKAATLLLNQNHSITQIALACGFNDSATFARAFKKHFTISAKEWRLKKNSKIHQDKKYKSIYIKNNQSKKNKLIKPIEVKKIFFPETTIAYIRHTGNYIGNSHLFKIFFKKLKNWANEKKYLNYPKTKDIIIYHDPLGITKEEKLRVSIGITVNQDIITKGEVSKLKIASNQYLVSCFELQNNQYSQAWTQVYRQEIPQRKFEPDDGYCFEMYSENCYNPQKNTTIVNIYVPIKKLI